MLNNMGFIYLNAGNNVKAMEYFEKVITKNPDYAYAYNNRASILMKEGEYQRALEAVEQSLVLDSDNAYAYRNMAICYAQLDNLEAACEALDAAEKAKFRLRLKAELEELREAYCREE